MANRGLIVEIIGDDRSFQKALSRSSSAASKFSRDINARLGSSVSVGDRFAPLLRNTKELQGQADQLSRRLDDLDDGLEGIGGSADDATAGMGRMAVKAGLAGIAITTAYHASRRLSDALEATGEEAFTTSGRFRNLASSILSGDIVGGIAALSKMPKTLDDIGVSADQAAQKYDRFKEVAGTDSPFQQLAQQAVDLVDAQRAAQNAADALADSVSRLGTAFITSTGQAVTFKGAVDDLGGLRGPGLVDQINKNLRANQFPQFPKPLKPIGPTAKNAAAQILAQARGDLDELLRLQVIERDRLDKALRASRGNVKQRTALNQQLAVARAAVMGTQKAIQANAEAAAKAAQAAAKAAAAEAEARRKQLAQQAEANRVARLAAEQVRQFRALGLTAEGERPTPTIANLRKQLASLSKRIIGTTADTANTRGLLKRIRAVLTDPIHQATEETRKAIVEMYDMIRDEIRKQSTKLNLRATSGLNTKKIVEGLGLSPELERIIRARLSHVNTRGMALSGQTAQAIAVAGGPPIVESHVTVQLDGEVVGRSVTKSQQKTRRRNPPQKRGPNSGV